MLNSEVLENILLKTLKRIRFLLIKIEKRGRPNPNTYLPKVEGKRDGR